MVNLELSGYFTFDSLHAGLFFMLFCHLLIFFKSTFSKNSIRIVIRVSNSLDPDQTQHFVGPDLVPNCLQKLSETTLGGKELTCQYFRPENGVCF